MGTQETLVDLGEAAIRTKGYGGFSYADIARDAGIRKASIHHHFPAKSDLGLAVLDRYADRLAAAFEAIQSRSHSGAEAMRRVIALYRDALGEGERMCLCAALSADTAAISEAMLAMLNRANEMTAERIEKILLTGRRDRTISVAGEPQLEARSILAQLQGAQLVARAAGNPEAFDTAVYTLAAKMTRH